MRLFVGVVRQGEEPVERTPFAVSSQYFTSCGEISLRWITRSRFFFFLLLALVGFFFTLMKSVLLAFTRRWQFPSFSCTTSVSVASWFITDGFDNFSSNKTVVANRD